MTRKEIEQKCREMMQENIPDKEALWYKVAAGAGDMMGLSSSISYIPFWLVLISLLFAVLVGMAAGFFPALRAMKLSPLAAIHNE